MKASFRRSAGCEKILADLDHLPPFAVFHDRSLKEMAKVIYPRTGVDLLRIYGVSEAKPALRQKVPRCTRINTVSSTGSGWIAVADDSGLESRQRSLQSILSTRCAQVNECRAPTRMLRHYAA